MKSSRLALLFGIAVFVLFAAREGFAQSSAPSSGARSQPDQVIKDLLSEVHQLRVAMQQMSVNTYRGQIMVERLRLQQDQVTRLTRELSAIRNESAEIKSQQASVKERLEQAVKQQEAGVVSEQQVNEFRAMAAELKRHDQTLSERETQVSQELEKERINLTDLNQRLDALEREILMTTFGSDSKEKPKQ